MVFSHVIIALCPHLRVHFPCLDPDYGFAFVTLFNCYFLIDASQKICERIQTQRNGGVLAIHDTILSPSLNSGQNVFLPYWGIYISRRPHPDTPMGRYIPFFRHNTFLLNGDQRIASYSLSPIPMVSAVPDKGLIQSLLIERLGQTPGLQLWLSVLLHCLITNFIFITNVKKHLSFLS